MENFSKNEVVEVFDSVAWSKIGDIGDNYCFYRKATIINIRKPGRITLYDVKFFSGEVSKGHFETSLRKIKVEEYL